MKTHHLGIDRGRPLLQRRRAPCHRQVQLRWSTATGSVTGHGRFPFTPEQLARGREFEKQGEEVRWGGRETNRLGFLELMSVLFSSGGLA